MKIDPIEERVLVFTPTGRDSQLTCSLLEKQGIAAYPCATIDEVRHECELGVGVVLMTEESLTSGSLRSLLDLLSRQEPWSDIPLLLFASNNESAASVLETLGTYANVTTLERPLRIAIFLGVVRSALRARQRQYQMRDVLQKLVEADRQKDYFLATLSHELRTPLTSMLGWIELLREGGLDQETIDHGLETIYRNANVQSQLIEDILSVSRIITGKLELNRRPMDLRDLIEAAISTAYPSAEAKGIQLHFRSDDDLKPVLGDGPRLQQVVANLLSNAVKFTPPGGRVDVGAKRSGNAAIINVTDTGQGINAEFLPYVFDRFSQADSSFTRSHGGLGLGLSIVRLLVEMHGGTVAVRSEGVGEGSVFMVTLPLAGIVEMNENATVTPSNSRSLGDAHARDTDRTLLSGVHVLLVEDNDDSREILSRILRGRGADVREARSASEALEAIRISVPDLLVSDIGMPAEDGYQLIHKVRRLDIGSAETLPAIALTGFVSAEDRSHALASGFQAHLAKPVDPADLVAAVARLVGRAVET